MPVTDPPTLAIARTVLTHGPISRSDLGRRVGLSAASLTRLTKPLLAAGFLTEADEGEQSAAVGRPARPLAVDGRGGWWAGVKITGTTLTAVSSDIRAKIIGRADGVLHDHEPESVASAIEEVLAQLAERSSPRRAPEGVGISFGGRADADGVVLSAAFLGWRKVPLGAMLSERLGCPVVVENDVVALTEAEHWFGLGRGADDLAVVTIGAGVGYGLVVHDEQVITPDSGLGPGGHFRIDRHSDQPPCKAGHRGCASALLATPAVLDRVERELGRAVTWDQFVGLATAGDPVAARIASQVAHHLGEFAAAVTDLTMVPLLVLGGEGIGLLDTPAARHSFDTALREERHPDAAAVRVLVGAPSFDEWARGAAAVAIQRTLRARWS